MRPCVRVPVLSSTTVSTAAAASRTSPPRSSRPRRAPAAEATSTCTPARPAQAERLTGSIGDCNGARRDITSSFTVLRAYAKQAAGRDSSRHAVFCHAATGKSASSGLGMSCSSPRWGWPSRGRRGRPPPKRPLPAAPPGPGPRHLLPLPRPGKLMALLSGAGADSASGICPSQPSCAAAHAHHPSIAHAVAEASHLQHAPSGQQVMLAIELPNQLHRDLDPTACRMQHVNKQGERSQLQRSQLQRNCI